MHGTPRIDGSPAPTPSAAPNPKCRLYHAVSSACA